MPGWIRYWKSMTKKSLSVYLRHEEGMLRPLIVFRETPSYQAKAHTHAA